MGGGLEVAGEDTALTDLKKKIYMTINVLILNNFVGTTLSNMR